MNDLKALRVVVAGAGAVGAFAALALARGGAEVTLVDPAAAADNASGVAAGMLAPASEVLLDPSSSDHYPVLLAALHAWAVMQQSAPDLPALERAGAVLQADGEAQAEALLARARGIGARLQALPAEAARRRAPGLAGDGPFLFAPDDARLEPAPMLQALHRALETAGGRRLTAAVTGLSDGEIGFQSGESIRADRLVLATGFDAAGAAEGLIPIKGQILRFAGAPPLTGPVVRGSGAYVVPSPLGAMAGATMEEGRADRRVDRAAALRLRSAAGHLFPALLTARYTAAAGVRAATRDGLPLVGPWRRPGVILACGARRNGWLLAPMMAQVIVERLLGEPASPAARAFDPARFAAP